jgi:hypothetical protein
MSKLIALRIPDDLLERLDCIKGKRSAVIVQILSASLYRGSGTPVSDEEVKARLDGNMLTNRPARPTLTPQEIHERNSGKVDRRPKPNMAALRETCAGSSNDPISKTSNIAQSSNDS